MFFFVENAVKLGRQLLVWKQQQQQQKRQVIIVSAVCRCGNTQECFLHKQSDPIEVGISREK